MKSLIYCLDRKIIYICKPSTVLAMVFSYTHLHALKGQTKNQNNKQSYQRSHFTTPLVRLWTLFQFPVFALEIIFQFAMELTHKQYSIFLFQCIRILTILRPCLGRAPMYYGFDRPAITHDLPALPYSLTDLEPYIDADTVKVHYLGHHTKYMENMNSVLQEWRKMVCIMAVC